MHIKLLLGLVAVIAGGLVLWRKLHSNSKSSGSNNMGGSDTSNPTSTNQS